MVYFVIIGSILLCAKRKSLNDTLTVKIMSEYIRQELKRRYILLTLTAPNVSGEELKTEINITLLCLNEKIQKYS